MYKNKITGLTMYETLNDILSSDIRELYEDSENYYFVMKPECFYDNGAWKVDKDDYKVSYIDYLDVMMKVAENKAHKTDISEFRKRVA